MLSKTDPSSDKKEPVVIKKYANRRLYNTETSTYVTLDDLADMVRRERDFVVFDAKTGDELTHAVLTQIIVDQESRTSQTLLPVPFLRQLIRFYGAGLEKIVPGYLQLSMEMFTREQERFRTQLAGTFGTGIFDAYSEQARKNFAMFEQAMTMFTPFGTIGARNGEAPSADADQPAASQATTAGAPPSAAPSSAAKASAPTASPSNSPGAELEELRAQLAAMQAKLERITERRS